MYRIQIESKYDNYIISFHGNNDLGKDYLAEAFIIADSRFNDQLKSLKNCYFLEASETNKTLVTCNEIIREMISIGVRKQDSIVVIGGGMLQDIGTLTASLYMRGIRWNYIPTTLMAMMDSCIGGKSSINVGKHKNIVGNFYPPNLVRIFPHYLNTLSSTEIASGLLEGIKICYAFGQETFRRFSQQMHNSKILTYPDSPDLVSQLIFTTLSAKKWFIEIDEHDMRERQLLNFGHTFGHALEAATNFIIPHGIAIGIGMLAALRFNSKQYGEFESSLENEVRTILRTSNFYSIFKPQIDNAIFVKAFSSDKKHSNNSYNLILSQQGKLMKVPIERNQANAQLALECILESVESLAK